MDFPKKELPVDPYLLGVWLGDGHRDNPIITNKEPIIQEYCVAKANELGMSAIVVDAPEINSQYIYLTNNYKGNPLRKFFASCVTDGGEKFIPQDYLTSSREDRLDLLAALLDTDGYYNGGCFEIATKYNTLKDNILFLARSLGFAAYAKRKVAAIKSLGFSGEYWRISISGDISIIPNKIPRKQASPRRQIKNVLRTGFSVEGIGKGAYYGFTLDGDGRFLLGDFTVTHNTFTIAYRVKAFLDQGVDPANILVCTFSRSQAEDMSLRILSFLKQHYPTIGLSALANGFGEGIGQITTIHATARRMLIHYPEYTKYSELQVAPTWKERSIIENFVERINWTYYNVREKKEALVGYQSILFYINNAKNAGVNLNVAELTEYYLSTGLGREHVRNLVSTTLHYQQELQRNNMWTFADMLYECEKQLREDAAFRSYWHDRFTHVLIDEAQDTNGQAMRIVHLLNPSSITVVGDADQTLYAFNGATPDTNLRTGFDQRFGGGRLSMSVNFRSQPNILKRAGLLIRHNYDSETIKYMKNLQPREGVAVGDDVTFSWYQDAEEEARGVVANLVQYIEEGHVPGDFFIMSRTNAQMAYFELELLNHNLPFVNLGVSSFFNRPVPRMLLNYMRLAVDPTDWEAFDIVHNVASCWMTNNQGKPINTRFLGQKFLERLSRTNSDGTPTNSLEEAYAHKYDTDQRGWTRWQRGVQDLQDTMQALAGYEMSHNAGSLASEITQIVVDKWIENEFGVETDASDGARDDLQVVLALAKRFTVRDFLEYVRQLTATKDIKPENMTDYILIGTIYKFKGLERPIVYVVGASQGLLPHRFSLGETPPTDGLPIPSTGSLWDERNVMYVAVTRAKDVCHISGIQNWATIKDPLEPSIFVQEMELL